MKRIFIVNPKSGYGKSLEISKAIDEVCKARKLDYEIIYTERPLDATEIAKSYKRDKLIVYSVGGDGTLNEVVNGLVGSKNILGVIPAGSGNDFYKSLKLYDDEYVKCDLGKINRHYFINIASVGLDAEIGDNAIIMKRKKIPRKMVYNAALFHTFFNFESHNYKIKVDGKDLGEGKKVLITVANGKIYGGGFKIAPDASINDGLLDVVIADDVSKPKIISLLLKLIQVKHPEAKEVTMLKAKKIQIKADKTITAGIDGEVLTDKAFKIEVIPNAITIYNDREFVEEVLSYEQRNKQKTKRIERR